jgi:ribosomal-protein-alanine N-acetyltransferase
MRINTVPILDNANLILRPVTLADVDAWYGYLAMPHAIEHTSWNLKSSDDLCVAIKKYNLDDPASPIRFVIVDHETDNLVGTIGFHTISPVNRTAEIAYDLHPQYWGRGIATLCCRAMVNWGFAQCGFVRVQATALDTNLASTRVLNKCGFLLEGKMHNYRMVRGAPRDFWMYARTMPLD